MKKKRIDLYVPGFIKQSIKQNKRYVLVEIQKGSKKGITPALTGLHLAYNIRDLLIKGQRYEIQRVRCIPGTHQVKEPVLST